MNQKRKILSEDYYDSKKHNCLVTCRLWKVLEEVDTWHMVWKTTATSIFKMSRRARKLDLAVRLLVESKIAHLCTMKFCISFA